MRSRNPPTPRPHSFTNEQIRAKAYEIWQKHPERSEAANWNAAIEALKNRHLQTLISLWRWTGFGEKKLWDLLQLLISISIPIVLLLGGQYFTTQNNDKQQTLADDKAKQDRQLADDKAKQDRQLADDKAKQDTLVKYLDQMADSLKDDLLSAKPGSEKFIIAQSRTVIALQSLDRKRQHLVVQFLQASGLNEVSAQTQPDKNGSIQLRAGDRILLYQAQMSKADLANNDLSGVVLVGVNLESANLGCIPPESKDPIQCSDLSLSNLTNANLTNANLYGANLYGANVRAKLSGANLSGAFLNNANLSGAFLNNADLRNVILSNANLSFADLSFADLSNANLIYVNLSGANLSNAFLSDANLSGAFLNNADLRSAFLSNVNLSNAFLSKAFLSNAFLLNGNFRRAESLTQQQLEVKEPPLLCNVTLPKNIQINPNRDCYRMPKELVERYPKQFKSLEEAKKYVDEQRRKRW